MGGRGVATCRRAVVVAIKGGGRPTLLLPHVKMLLIPIKLFFSDG